MFATTPSLKRFLTPVLIGLTCLSIVLSSFAIITRSKQGNIRFVRVGYVLNIAMGEDMKIIQELFAPQIQEIEELKKSKEALEKKEKEMGYLSSKEEKKLARLVKKIKKLEDDYEREVTQKIQELSIKNYTNMIKFVKELKEENRYTFVLIEGLQKGLSFIAEPKLDITDAVLIKMGLEIPKKEA